MSGCSAVALHVERVGEGRPIVLGHGFGGSARNFRPQARALGGHSRFVLFDARGHARSEAPSVPEAYLPECFVSDLGRLVDEGGEQTSVVGGLSMGAGIALRYALAYPDRVRALVLAAFPRGAGEGGSKAWSVAFADAIERDGLEAAGARFVWGERSRFDPKGAALIRQGFLEHPPHALVHTLRRLLSVQPSVEEMRGALQRLHVPVLVVVGADDAYSLAPSRALAAALPRAELVVIERAGHVVNLAAPHAFNDALDAFLERV